MQRNHSTISKILSFQTIHSFRFTHSRLISGCQVRLMSFKATEQKNNDSNINISDCNHKNETKWKENPPYVYNNQFKVKYSGKCDCGRVEIECQNDPLDVKICHCVGCQKLHGAPMQIAAIFNKKDIQFTKQSLDNLCFYNSELKLSQHILPCKLSCKYCNSLIADEGRNMFLLFPTILDFKNNNIKSRFPESFKYNHHIFYSARCVDIDDNFPKYDGFRPSKH